MTLYILAALGIFVAMGLMRMTYRMSRRQHDDGIRWRGIDWDVEKRKREQAEREARDDDHDEG